MDAVQDQSAGSGNSARSKLRYPLRSATKANKDNSAMAEISNSSVPPKRGRPPSNVSKSVSVLDVSGKKSTTTKSTRRLSVPAKAAASPLTRSIGSITPISETRMKRSTNGQGKSETPISDISKSVNRRKFSVLSSASYWLSQIKLSESAAKHSISVGFFKLALESGCEPLQRMRDELKSYARRHNLVELGEPVKELLRSYNIVEDLEQLQVSETCSLVPEATQSSSEDCRSSSSTAGASKLKPKSLNSKNIQVSPVAESAKKESNRKIPTTGNRLSLNKNSMRSKPDADIKGVNEQKKPQKPSKVETKKEKVKPKNQGKKSASEKDSVDPLPAEETQQEDKENMDAQQLEEISLTQ
ncbi:hypothetical protein BVC80_285g28 [Macleaya cordata]|uniref:Uncharacterized protein n=1 Tax=Macleaya cordata TaxID=56857 RepID=A0A200QS94_MACCD|nr:hypothetical protein BVC80_285g28 [Macleaya cordata]